MQFLKASAWMRTSLPRMTEIAEILRAMLEERMQGAPRRIPKVVSNLDLPGRDWTSGYGQASNVFLYLLALAVT